MKIKLNKNTKQIVALWILIGILVFAMLTQISIREVDETKDNSLKVHWTYHSIFELSYLFQFLLIYLFSLLNIIFWCEVSARQQVKA